MNKVTLLSDDAPLSAYYGHPKGVAAWEDLEGVAKRMDSELQTRLRPHAGSLVVDHKADHKKRRYVRLHGIPVAVIRYGDSWRVFKEFTASGREESGKAKDLKGCRAAIAALL